MSVKALIRDIVTAPVVVVVDPAVQEIHEPLAGSQALPGSPAGSEAKPKGIRQGAKAPAVP